jgi:hypothetical protein
MQPGIKDELAKLGLWIPPYVPDENILVNSDRTEVRYTYQDAGGNTRTSWWIRYSTNDRSWSGTSSIN